MAWVEVPPAAPTKVEGTKPLFDRPAGYVAYVPPPIPDAVPETALAITEPEPEFIPVFDGVLGWFTTWCLKRNRNSAIVGAARALINTETFEHIVGAALNSRSKLKIKMPDSLKTSKSGASRRHWGRVTIIS